MTTEALIRIIHDRGMRIYLDAQGRPTLTGSTGQLTPALLTVIIKPAHRQRIIDWIKAQGDANVA